MAFKTKNTSEKQYDSIEALFRDIRTKKIDALYSHQADTLKVYQDKYSESKNVALELPTGSGKTLIGLLIGEYRRRVKEEKIVFACSTNQLVNQVVEQANKKYGIKATAFTGSQKEYSESDKGDYYTANTIAVTNYSSVFNVKPFFNDADTIILDDAHVAENYIASCWSLDISRIEFKEIYNSVLEIVKNQIEYTLYSKLANDGLDPFEYNFVHLIPAQKIYNVREVLANYFDRNLSREKTSNLYFTWFFIKEHLNACNFYISWKSILIRPIIPPSLSIKSFESAKQRIYMSATLGSGGDLERIIGVKKIDRIPLPIGWDKQGQGRRFFVFPELALTGADRAKLFVEANRIFKRSLALVPDSARQKELEGLAIQALKFKVFNAASIEKSKSEFIKTENAIAIVANRYEGMDFEGDECRLLFVVNLPKTINNQETFLYQRMASMMVILDRIRTRIMQAIGRCTRGASDYSCVVVFGDDVSRHLVEPAFRKYFHPELQAEISFGITQSRGSNLKNILDNINLFMSQSEEWIEAQKLIYDERDISTQIEIPGTSKLSEAVSREVDYQYYLWHEDYKAAVDAAQDVINKLSGGSELNGYRGFWNYLASVASFLASKDGHEEFAKKTNHYLLEAAKCSRSLTWLRKLSDENFTDSSSDYEWDSFTASNVEKLDEYFNSFGVSNTNKFEKELKEIQDGILSNEAKKFEDAHVRLGKMLGFTADKNSQDGAPDPYWISDNKLCFVFEDHFRESDEILHVDKVGQALRHPTWIKKNIPNGDKMEIYSIIITNAIKLDKEASAFTDGTFYWNVKDFRSWVIDALAAIHISKVSYTSGNEIWREDTMNEFMEAKISPKAIIDIITKTPLNALPLG